VVVAADYPFLEVFWTLIVFFLWVAWFVLLFRIVGDVFRRHDIGGGKKTLWLIFILFVPFIGVFAYLIANADDMARRNVQEAQAAQSQFDDYVRTTAGSGGPAGEIESAKRLLDSGAITQTEYDAIKQKALAQSA
jgi:Phospholipase_D-nuclease N-terminal